MRTLAARGAGMIRIDSVWLATEPLDMRAGIDSALARVVKVFGGAHPHTAYLFANRRANRMKVLVHDGIGFWLAGRRLHQGHFIWPTPGAQTRSQFESPATRRTGAGPALEPHWRGWNYHCRVMARFRSESNINQSQTTTWPC